MTPEQVQQFQQMSPALAGGLGIGFMVFGLISYLFFAFCLAKIGEKLGHPFGKAFLWSIVPILNLIFLFQLSGKPLWWIILLLIPIVNIVVLVMVWMAICERRGKPGWWGILMAIPIANLIVFLTLAFGSKGTLATA